MTMITLEDVRDRWNACYKRTNPGLLELLFDRPMSAVEVLTRQDGEWRDVPLADRFWVVLRESILPDRVLRLFAAACAEKACQDAGWTDPRSLAAIKAARDFADGKITAEELNTARAVAWDAWAETGVAEAAWAWSEARSAWAWAARAAARRYEIHHAGYVARTATLLNVPMSQQLQTLLALIEEHSQRGEEKQ